MKIIRFEDGVTTAGVELTRRNLLSLLAKLDGQPSDSACTLTKDNIFVRAVEDAEHYEAENRLPGDLHPATDAEVAAIRRSYLPGAGRCTIAADDHGNTCNGYPRPDCPGYEKWLHAPLDDDCGCGDC